MATADEESVPIFKAVTGSARQIFQLLNCIRFAPQVNVQITGDGMRFAVEVSKTMQGVAFLDKALFTSFSYNLGATDNDADPDPPSFQISLHALLETLQIFGAAEAASSRSRPEDSWSSNIRPQRPNAFSSQTLGMAGLCRLSYVSLGSPLQIILEEQGVTTVCNLNTYESDNIDEIPFDRDELLVKVIMQSRYLYDAISEISAMTQTGATSDSRLTILASPRSPYLVLSALGTYGSTSVDFSKSRELLDTFTVASRWSQSYKFEMIKGAYEAMRLASKVSLRSDQQGVLSLQFMVENDTGGVSFIEFRFVPYIGDDDESGSEGEEEADE